MAMRLQSAPSIQPLNKYCLNNTRTTHHQNELLVRRCVVLIRIAALYKNQVQIYEGYGLKVKILASDLYNSKCMSYQFDFSGQHY